MLVKLLGAEEKYILNTGHPAIIQIKVSVIRESPEKDFGPQNKLGVDKMQELQCSLKSTVSTHCPPLYTPFC